MAKTDKAMRYSAPDLEVTTRQVTASWNTYNAPLRTSECLSVHGVLGGTHTRKQTNNAFADAKRKQQKEIAQLKLEGKWK